MPMQVYGETNEPEVKVLYSPVMELICAVHILTDPAHHQFELKWADETLARFTEEERKALETIASYRLSGIELVNFAADLGELVSINKFIESMKQIDTLDYFYYLLNEEIEKTKIHRAFNDHKERFRIQEKLKWIIEEDELMYFFNHPDEIKEKAVKVFEAVNNSGFMGKLEKCRDKVEYGTQYVNSFVGKDSIDAVLEKVSGLSRKVFSGYKTYYIMPSYFVSPRFVWIYMGEKLFAVFDCRVTRDKKEALLEELSTILKVIDDKSRMEILRRLVNRKSYGKALSDEVGISTPTVSHHLDILKQAGFVKEEKIRNIKYFYADKERLKKVIQDINKYFFTAE